MIISDLGYLEVVSEVPSLVGGDRENTTKVKQKIKITVKNSIVTGSISATNDSTVISSNDNL